MTTEYYYMTQAIHHAGICYRKYTTALYRLRKMIVLLRECTKERDRYIARVRELEGRLAKIENALSPTKHGIK